jgi:hypothetical protein
VRLREVEQRARAENVREQLAEAKRREADALAFRLQQEEPVRLHEVEQEGAENDAAEKAASLSSWSLGLLAFVIACMYELWPAATLAAFSAAAAFLAAKNAAAFSPAVAEEKAALYAAAFASLV